MPYGGEKYCLVQWRKTPDGLVQDLPVAIGWRLLAEPPQKPGEYYSDLDNPNINYGVYLVTCPDEMPWPPEIEFVPDYLVDLLDSATHHYPPALAIARDRVRKVQAEMSRSEFMGALANALRTLLEGQRDSPFFLARVLKEELGYKSAGQYHWVVGYHEYQDRMEANFVSSDFFVYGCPATDFDIDPEWLKERFATA